MNILATEKFIEENFKDVSIYPITVIKFLLNRRKILNHFAKAANSNFEIRGQMYKKDNKDCPMCKEKQAHGVMCRLHTSINRVLDAKIVGYDLDTQTYFYKNEIFRMVGDKLVIIYCPHTKLIEGDLTDSKIRMINTITIDDPTIVFPEYETRQFLSTNLLDRNMSCWFDEKFTLVTIPKDRNYSDFLLKLNTKKA